jgi:hypothetical protein
MANLYTGKLIGNDGKALPETKITLKSGDFTQSSITDKNGDFKIIAPDSIDTQNTTLTFSKDKYTLYSIKNPQLTGDFDIIDSVINPLLGGRLKLQGQFDSGKYIFSSLSPSVQEKLNWELYNTVLFISNYPGNHNVIITASESQVPNYDREEFLENGEINSKWAGPEGERRPDGKLEAGKLSELRASNLKKYVENAFTLYGKPIPPDKGSLTITTDTKIGKTAFISGSLANDPKYLAEQYVEIQVVFKQPPCVPITIQEEKGGFGKIKTIQKPPGSKTITIDAFQYPDRFGIDNNLLRYYIQNPTTEGNIKSWRFIVYLGNYSSIPKPDNTLDKPELILKEDLRKILLEDYKIKIINAENKETTHPDIIRIKSQLREFVIRQRKATKGEFDNTSDVDILNWLFGGTDSLGRYIESIVNPGSEYTYLYPLKRENIILDLPNKEMFDLNQNVGSVTQNSIYSINMCNK